MCRIKMRFPRRIILRNIFHTSYKKRCIILYIVHPFLNFTNTHTNGQIAISMAKVLSEQRYNVDVAQYNTLYPVNLNKYDLILGFGDKFDKFLIRNQNNDNTKEIITIGLLTGASPYFSNMAELQRLNYFEKRNHQKLMLHRQVGVTGGLMDLRALQNLTCAICTGNDWTVRTWNMMIDNVYKITATGFSFITLKDIDRNIEQAKKNFLWFSGAGMLHKGLDLCIEAFRNVPELHLYVAGVMDSDFENFYKEDFLRPNIHYCGFVNVATDAYKELCEKCLFSIFPSSSEGGATSVLTTMFTGMIPVVTREASVDIEDWGIEIETIDVDYIIELVNNLSKMPSEELKERSNAAYEYAMANHTVERFQQDFRTIIERIIGER